MQATGRGFRLKHIVAAADPGFCDMLKLLAMFATVARVVLSIPTSHFSRGMYDEYQQDFQSPQMKMTITANGVLSSKPVEGLCDDVKQYAGLAIHPSEPNYLAISKN